MPLTVSSIGEGICPLPPPYNATVAIQKLHFSRGPCDIVSGGEQIPTPILFLSTSATSPPVTCPSAGAAACTRSDRKYFCMAGHPLRTCDLPISPCLLLRPALL